MTAAALSINLEFLKASEACQSRLFTVSRHCLLRISHQSVPKLSLRYHHGKHNTADIENEHHAIFNCSGYTNARELFQVFV